MKFYALVLLLTIEIIISDNTVTAQSNNMTDTTESTTASTTESTTASATESTMASTTAPTTVSTMTPTTASTTESTTASTTESTRASTTASTTASTATPTTGSTETPTTASTKAPSTASTTASTETPITASTEAPTTASTEAPTTASTKVPTTASTKAPSTALTTASTNAPTTASTKATTSEATKASATSLSTTVYTSTETPPTTVAPTVKQNFTCDLNGTTKFSLTGAFALAITYNTTQNTSNTVYINVPHPDNHQANCTSVEAIKFEFFNGWSIEYIFGQDESITLLAATQKYHVSNITVTYVHDEHLPNTTVKGTKFQVGFESTDFLQATSDGYYSCKSNISVDIGSTVVLTTVDFKYKAYNEEGDINLDSGKVTECTADEETSSVVPIAVGAALAGLVVVVLIAYLIGRKRSRKGYENV